MKKMLSLTTLVTLTIFSCGGGGGGGNNTSTNSSISNGTYTVSQTSVSYSNATSSIKFPQTCPISDSKIADATFPPVSKSAVESFFQKLNGRNIYIWNGNWHTCDLSFNSDGDNFNLTNCSNPEDDESSGFIYEKNNQGYLHFDRWDVDAQVISVSENTLCFVDFSEDGSITCFSSKPEGYPANALEGHYWIVYDWNPKSHSWDLVKDKSGNIECWGFNDGKIYYGDLGVIGNYQVDNDKIVYHNSQENGNFNLEYLINLSDINSQEKIVGKDYQDDSNIKVFVEIY